MESTEIEFEAFLKRYVEVHASSDIGERTRRNVPRPVVAEVIVAVGLVGDRVVVFRLYHLAD